MISYSLTKVNRKPTKRPPKAYGNPTKSLPKAYRTLTESPLKDHQRSIEIMHHCITALPHHGITASPPPCNPASPIMVLLHHCNTASLHHRTKPKENILKVYRKLNESPPTIE